MTGHVRVGVLRLADSAPIIMARARGYFAAEGLDVSVVVEPSWSNIADKMTFGVLDAGVMLPPLALILCASAVSSAVGVAFFPNCASVPGLINPADSSCLGLIPNLPIP